MHSADTQTPDYPIPVEDAILREIVSPVQYAAPQLPSPKTDSSSQYERKMDSSMNQYDLKGMETATQHQMNEQDGATQYDLLQQSITTQSLIENQLCASQTELKTQQQASSPILRRVTSQALQTPQPKGIQKSDGLTQYELKQDEASTQFGVKKEDSTSQHVFVQDDKVTHYDIVGQEGSTQFEKNDGEMSTQHDLMVQDITTQSAVVLQDTTTQHESILKDTPTQQGTEVKDITTQSVIENQLFTSQTDLETQQQASSPILRRVTSQALQTPKPTGVQMSDGLTQYELKQGDASSQSELKQVENSSQYATSSSHVPTQYDIVGQHGMTQYELKSEEKPTQYDSLLKDLPIQTSTEGKDQMSSPILPRVTNQVLQTPKQAIAPFSSQHDVRTQDNTTQYVFKSTEGTTQVPTIAKNDQISQTQAGKPLSTSNIITQYEPRTSDSSCQHDMLTVKEGVSQHDLLQKEGATQYDLTKQSSDSQTFFKTSDAGTLATPVQPIFSSQITQTASEPGIIVAALSTQTDEPEVTATRHVAAFTERKLKDGVTQIAKKEKDSVTQYDVKGADSQTQSEQTLHENASQSEVKSIPQGSSPILPRSTSQALQASIPQVSKSDITTHIQYNLQNAGTGYDRKDQDSATQHDIVRGDSVTQYELSMKDAESQLGVESIDQTSSPVLRRANDMPSQTPSEKILKTRDDPTQTELKQNDSPIQASVNTTQQSLSPLLPRVAHQLQQTAQPKGVAKTDSSTQLSKMMASVPTQSLRMEKVESTQYKVTAEAVSTQYESKVDHTTTQYEGGQMEAHSQSHFETEEKGTTPAIQSEHKNISPALQQVTDITTQYESILLESTTQCKISQKNQASFTAISETSDQVLQTVEQERPAQLSTTSQYEGSSHDDVTQYEASVVERTTQFAQELKDTMTQFMMMYGDSQSQTTVSSSDQATSPVPALTDNSTAQTMEEKKVLTSEVMTQHEVKLLNLMIQTLEDKISTIDSNTQYERRSHEKITQHEMQQLDTSTQHQLKQHDFDVQTKLSLGHQATSPLLSRHQSQLLQTPVIDTSAIHVVSQTELKRQETTTQMEISLGEGSTQYETKQTDSVSQTFSKNLNQSSSPILSRAKTSGSQTAQEEPVMTTQTEEKGTTPAIQTASDQAHQTFQSVADVSSQHVLKINVTATQHEVIEKSETSQYAIYGDEATTQYELSLAHAQSQSFTLDDEKSTSTTIPDFNNQYMQTMERKEVPKTESSTQYIVKGQESTTQAETRIQHDSTQYEGDQMDHTTQYGPSVKDGSVQHGVKLQDAHSHIEVGFKDEATSSTHPTFMEQVSQTISDVRLTAESSSQYFLTQKASHTQVDVQERDGVSQYDLKQEESMTQYVENLQDAHAQSTVEVGDVTTSTLDVSHAHQSLQTAKRSMIETTSQYEQELLSSTTQSEREDREISCQHEQIGEDSSTQHDRDTMESTTQYEANQHDALSQSFVDIEHKASSPKLQRLATQHLQTLPSGSDTGTQSQVSAEGITTQYEKDEQESASQHEIHQVESTTQHELKQLNAQSQYALESTSKSTSSISINLSNMAMQTAQHEGQTGTQYELSTNESSSQHVSNQQDASSQQIVQSEHKTISSALQQVTDITTQYESILLESTTQCKISQKNQASFTAISETSDQVLQTVEQERPAQLSTTSQYEGSSQDNVTQYEASVVERTTQLAQELKDTMTQYMMAYGDSQSQTTVSSSDQATSPVPALTDNSTAQTMEEKKVLTSEVTTQHEVKLLNLMIQTLEDKISTIDSNTQYERRSHEKITQHEMQQLDTSTQHLLKQHDFDGQTKLSLGHQATSPLLSRHQSQLLQTPVIKTSSIHVVSQTELKRQETTTQMEISLGEGSTQYETKQTDSVSQTFSKNLNQSSSPILSRAKTSGTQPAQEVKMHMTTQFETKAGESQTQTQQHVVHQTSQILPEASHKDSQTPKAEPKIEKISQAEVNLTEMQMQTTPNTSQKASSPVLNRAVNKDAQTPVKDVIPKASQIIRSSRDSTTQAFTESKTSERGTEVLRIQLRTGSTQANLQKPVTSHSAVQAKKTEVMDKMLVVTPSTVDHSTPARVTKYSTKPTQADIKVTSKANEAQTSHVVRSATTTTEKTAVMSAISQTEVSKMAKEVVTQEIRLVERSALTMPEIKPSVFETSTQHDVDVQMVDSASATSPITHEGSTFTTPCTALEQSCQTDVHVEEEEFIEIVSQSEEIAPITFREAKHADGSTETEHYDLNERAVSPFSDDLNDVPSQTNVEMESVAVQFDEPDFGPLYVNTVSYVQDGRERHTETIFEKAVEAPAQTESVLMDAQQQTLPDTEDGFTETVAMGIDFGEQTQPLTIDQATVMHSGQMVSSEVQVQMGQPSTPMRDTGSQHASRPVDSFAQVDALTVDEGMSTITVVKSTTSAQYSPPGSAHTSPKQQRKTMANAETSTSVKYRQTTDTQTSKPLQYNLSTQFRPTTKSQESLAKIIPESADMGMVTKPLSADADSQARVDQSSNSAQCDTKVADTQSQYEHQDAADMSVQVMPTCADLGNSPIFKRREHVVSSTQTDPMFADFSDEFEDGEFLDTQSDRISLEEFTWDTFVDNLQETLDGPVVSSYEAPIQQINVIQDFAEMPRAWGVDASAQIHPTLLDRGIGTTGAWRHDRGSQIHQVHATHSTQSDITTRVFNNSSTQHAVDVQDNSLQHDTVVPSSDRANSPISTEGRDAQSQSKPTTSDGSTMITHYEGKDFTIQTTPWTTDMASSPVFKRRSENAVAQIAPDTSDGGTSMTAVPYADSKFQTDQESLDMSSQYITTHTDRSSSPIEVSSNNASTHIGSLLTDTSTYMPALDSKDLPTQTSTSTSEGSVQFQILTSERVTEIVPAPGRDIDLQASVRKSDSISQYREVKTCDTASSPIVVRKVTSEESTMMAQIHAKDFHTQVTPLTSEGTSQYPSTVTSDKISSPVMQKKLTSEHSSQYPKTVTTDKVISPVFTRKVAIDESTMMIPAESKDGFAQVSPVRIEGASQPMTKTFADTQSSPILQRKIGTIEEGTMPPPPQHGKDFTTQVAPVQEDILTQSDAVKNADANAQVKPETLDGGTFMTKVSLADGSVQIQPDIRDQSSQLLIPSENRSVTTIPPMSSNVESQIQKELVDGNTFMIQREARDSMAQFAPTVTDNSSQYVESPKADKLSSPILTRKEVSDESTSMRPKEDKDLGIQMTPTSTEKVSSPILQRKVAIDESTTMDLAESKDVVMQATPVTTDSVSQSLKSSTTDQLSSPVLIRKQLMDESTLILPQPVEAKDFTTQATPTTIEKISSPVLVRRQVIDESTMMALLEAKDFNSQSSPNTTHISSQSERATMSNMPSSPVLLRKTDEGTMMIESKPHDFTTQVTPTTSDGTSQPALRSTFDKPSSPVLIRKQVKDESSMILPPPTDAKDFTTQATPTTSDGTSQPALRSTFDKPSSPVLIRKQVKDESSMILPPPTDAKDFTTQATPTTSDGTSQPALRSTFDKPSSPVLIRKQLMDESTLILPQPVDAKDFTTQATPTTIEKISSPVLVRRQVIDESTMMALLEAKDFNSQSSPNTTHISSQSERATMSDKPSSPVLQRKTDEGTTITESKPQDFTTQATPTTSEKQSSPVPSRKTVIDGGTIPIPSDAKDFNTQATPPTTEKLSSPVLIRRNVIEEGTMMASLESKDLYTQATPTTSDGVSQSLKELTVDRLTSPVLIRKVMADESTLILPLPIDSKDFNTQVSPPTIEMESQSVDTATSEKMNSPVLVRKVAVNESTMMEPSADAKDFTTQISATTTDYGSQYQKTSTSEKLSSPVMQRKTAIDEGTTNIVLEARDFATQVSPTGVDQISQAKWKSTNETTTTVSVEGKDFTTQSRPSTLDTSTLPEKLPYHDTASSPITMRKSQDSQSQVQPLTVEDGTEMVKTESSDRTLQVYPENRSQSSQYYTMNLPADVSVQHTLETRESTSTPRNIQLTDRGGQAHPVTTEFSTQYLAKRDTYEKCTEVGGEISTQEIPVDDVVRPTIVQPVEAAPVFVQPTISYAERLRLREEIRQEAKYELRREIKEELIEEIREEIINEVRDDIRAEFITSMHEPQQRPLVVTKSTTPVQTRQYDETVEAKPYMLHEKQQVEIKQKNFGNQHKAPEKISEPTKKEEVSPVRQSLVPVREPPSEEFITTIKHEVRDEVIDELTEELTTSIRDQLSLELKEEFKEEMRETVMEEFREEIFDDYREELIVEFAPRIKHEIEEEVREDLEVTIRRELEPRIREEIKEEYIQERVKELLVESLSFQAPKEPDIKTKPSTVERGTLPPYSKALDNSTEMLVVSKDASVQMEEIKPVKIDEVCQTQIRNSTRGTSTIRSDTKDSKTQVHPTTSDRGTTPAKQNNLHSASQTDITLMKHHGGQSALLPELVHQSLQVIMRPLQTHQTVETRYDVTSKQTSMTPRQHNPAYSQTEMQRESRVTQANVAQKEFAMQSRQPRPLSNTGMQFVPTTAQKETMYSPKRLSSTQSQSFTMPTRHTSIEPDRSIGRVSRAVQPQKRSDVTDHIVQIEPVTREGASSPFFFPEEKIPTHDRSLSPVIFYSQRPEFESTPPGLESLSPRPIGKMMTPPTSQLKQPKKVTIEMPSTERTPLRLTPVTPPETQRQFQSGFRLHDRTKDSSTRLFDSEVSRTVQGIEKLEPSREVTYQQPVAQYRPRSTFHTRTDIQESHSTINQVIVDNMPPNCRMVLVHQTTAGTTYTTAMMTESLSRTSMTTMSSGSVLTQMSYKPPTFLKSDDADSLELSDPDSLDEKSDSSKVDELERIRRDLRLSKVISSGDQTTLVSYLVDDKKPTGRPSLGMSPYSTRPKSTKELLYGKPGFPKVDQGPSDRLHDEKGSPIPSILGETPTELTSSASPGMKPTHIMHRKPRPSPESTPMVTRLEELLRKSTPTNYGDYGWLMEKGPEKPKKDEYDLPSVEKLRTRFTKPRDGPPGRPADDSPSDIESEVNTTDSETDSESWQAVMDFQSPYLHEDPKYWPYTRPHRAPGVPSSESEAYDSDDDTQTVCGEFDLTTLRGIESSSSEEDINLPSAEAPRRRKQSSKFKTSLIRKELSLSEVVSPRAPASLTSYQSMPDGEHPLAGRRSKSMSDLRRPAASVSGSGMSRAEWVPSESRYARVVERVRDTRPSWGRYSRLSTSETDISPRKSLHDFGKF
ncbi:mucin-17 [Strongylocentrotus purpuratus]|uniref:Uncharacterized protein n=1 Tax=Strongylocentrotus purpuratus TaxID=7668 RepID=A0A7M7PKY1_STRPU|nr:mucin-17 [Strongylocentrotus purpuratus]